MSTLRGSERRRESGRHINRALNTEIHNRSAFGDLSALPEVTVLMISYNHRPYITQAIESVFSQRYPGVIRLIVADDCSTDGTQVEIERLKLMSPIAMDVVFRQQNVGGLQNLQGAWQMATGSYIAILEGDDYWLDDDKLALQVAALEDRPSATIAFGLAAVVNETIEPQLARTSQLPPVNTPTLDDLLVDNFVPTCTVVYRLGILKEFPDWFAECLVRDWLLHLIHASLGDIVYLDRVLAVYRIHGGGRWTSMPHQQRVQGSIALRRRVSKEFGLPAGWTEQMLCARTMVTISLGTGMRLEALKCLVTAVRMSPGIVRERRFIYAILHSLLGAKGTQRARRLRSRLQQNRGYSPLPV